MKAMIVDRQAIKNNLSAVKKRAGSAELIADLSGNGQGLGLIEMAHILREDGVRRFAVTEVKDAAALRAGGFTEEQILMLRSTVDTQELNELVELGVVCTAGSYDACIALNGIAASRSTVVEIQLKIDTGLGRYGFLPTETDKMLNVYRNMSSLAVIGVYTRLSASWRDRRLTGKQLADFNNAVEVLQKAGCDTGMVHALDSAALFRYDCDPMDAVLVGSALIGCLPGRGSFGLERPAHVEASLEEISWIQRGERIGSGGECTLRRSSKVGVLSLGWYNGFGVLREGLREERRGALRRLRVAFSSSKAWAPDVRIGGKRVRVLGRVGMTFMLLDVTDMECNTGDRAVLEADPRMLHGLPIIYK